ncbi:hypothetical protein BGX27_006120, partial [Mortierella sp. AM989]
MGINRNFTAVISQSHASHGNVTQILYEYCTTQADDVTPVDQIKARFETAERVFSSDTENIPDEQNTGRSTSKIDTMMQTMYDDVRQVLKRYWNYRKLALVPAPASTSPSASTSAPTSASTSAFIPTAIQVSTTSPRQSERNSHPGYLKLMPGNNFKAKEYKKGVQNDVTIQSDTPSPKKKKRKKKQNQKKRNRATLYNPCSRKARTQNRGAPDDDEPNQPSRTNNLKTATV